MRSLYKELITNLSINLDECESLDEIDKYITLKTHEKPTGILSNYDIPLPQNTTMFINENEVRLIKRGEWEAQVVYENNQVSKK